MLISVVRVGGETFITAFPDEVSVKLKELYHEVLWDEDEEEEWVNDYAIDNEKVLTDLVDSILREKSIFRPQSNCKVVSKGRPCKNKIDFEECSFLCQLSIKVDASGNEYKLNHSIFSGETDYSIMDDSIHTCHVGGASFSMLETDFNEVKSLCGGVEWRPTDLLEEDFKAY